jgi:hypothetical protein
VASRPDDPPRPPKVKDKETGRALFVRAKAIIKRLRAVTQNAALCSFAKAAPHWLADFLIEPEPLDDDRQLDPRFRDDGASNIPADDYACESEASGPALDLG